MGKIIGRCYPRFVEILSRSPAREVIEEMYEPHLMQIGLIERNRACFSLQVFLQKAF